MPPMLKYYNLRITLETQYDKSCVFDGEMAKNKYMSRDVTVEYIERIIA